MLPDTLLLCAGILHVPISDWLLVELSIRKGGTGSRDPVLHSSSDFLDSSSGTEAFSNNVWAYYSATPDPDVASPSSRFQATIHHDAAWRLGRCVHNQSTTFPTCSTPRLRIPFLQHGRTVTPVRPSPAPRGWPAAAKSSCRGRVPSLKSSEPTTAEKILGNLLACKSLPFGEDRLQHRLAPCFQELHAVQRQHHLQVFRPCTGDTSTSAALFGAGFVRGGLVIPLRMLCCPAPS